MPVKFNPRRIEEVGRMFAEFAIKDMENDERFDTEHLEIDAVTHYKNHLEFEAIVVIEANEYTEAMQEVFESRFFKLTKVHANHDGFVEIVLRMPTDIVQGLAHIKNEHLKEVFDN